MDALFWSLFGPLDLEMLKIGAEDEKQKLTGTVGTALYAAYMTVAVVVMLNALIAMMSNTYTRVEVSNLVAYPISYSMTCE